MILSRSVFVIFLIVLGSTSAFTGIVAPQCTLHPNGNQIIQYNQDGSCSVVCPINCKKGELADYDTCTCRTTFYDSSTVNCFPEDNFVDYFNGAEWDYQTCHWKCPEGPVVINEDGTLKCVPPSNINYTFRHNDSNNFPLIALVLGGFCVMGGVIGILAYLVLKKKK